MIINYYNNSKFLAYKFYNKLLLWGNIEDIPDYLYIIELTDYNNKKYIKIGITNNVKKRINPISKDYKTYKILLDKKIPKAQDIETSLKQKFLNYRAKKITTIINDKKQTIDVPSPTETFIYENVITKITQIIKDLKNIEVINKIEELNIAILNKHFKETYKRFIVEEPEPVKLIFLNFQVGQKYLKENNQGKLAPWYRVTQDNNFIKLFNELYIKFKNTELDKRIKYFKSALNKNKLLSEKQLRWLDNEFNKL